MSKACFFGHRNINSTITPILRAEIENHIVEKGVNTFYVGVDGKFDTIVAAILRELQKKYSYISIYRILAYLPTDKDEYRDGQYEKTIYPEGLELVPQRFAIKFRNRWIVEQTDFVIAYVQLDYGGAYEAVKYAERKKKSIINIARIGKD